MLDGRVKTLHPKVHGGILARRDDAGARGGARASFDSDRSISSSSISIRSARPWRRRAARSRTRSRTSTSAVPRWCAPRRRTGATSASSSTRPTTPRCSRNSQASGGVLSDRDALRARAEGVLAHRLVRRRDLELAHRARRPMGRVRRFPTASTCRRSRSRICATARIRISRRRSTATSNRSPGTIATFRQLQGKELSFNNIADGDAAWECVKILRPSPRA